MDSEPPSQEYSHPDTQDIMFIDDSDVTDEEGMEQYQQASPMPVASAPILWNSGMATPRQEPPAKRVCAMRPSPEVRGFYKDFMEAGNETHRLKRRNAVITPPPFYGTPVRRYSPTPASPAPVTPPGRYVLESDDEDVILTHPPMLAPPALVPVADVEVNDFIDIKEARKKAVNWAFTGFQFPAEFSTMTPEEYKVHVEVYLRNLFATAGFDVKYVCAGLEVCPETKKLHLQGFVILDKRAYLSAMKKVHPTWRWTQCSGSAAENVKYCNGMCDKKQYTLNPLFVEHGTIPIEKHKAGGEATKAKFAECHKLAKDGNWDDLARLYPQIYISHYANLHKINQNEGNLPNPFENPVGHTGIWLWSKKGGTGKTMMVRDQFRASLFVKNRKENWDGYKGEHYAVIDDVDRKDAAILGPHLKCWCSDTEFTGNIKFGHKTIHLKHLIVTSNYSIDQVFGDCDIQVYEPITLRFKQIELKGTYEGRGGVQQPALLAPDHLATIKGGNGFIAPQGYVA
jgi:hypothetical protein